MKFESPEMILIETVSICLLSTEPQEDTDDSYGKIV